MTGKAFGKAMWIALGTAIPGVALVGIIVAAATAVLTAGTTTSAALTTTFTGLLLLNPNNSTANFVINKVGMSFGVAFAAASAIGLQVGNQSTALLSGLTTTNTSVTSNYVSKVASQGITYSAATTTAPALATVFGTGLTGAITTVPAYNGVLIDLEGSIILPPGAWVATYTSTASGGSGLLAASIQYEEVPL
jgi:hypothetical protein